MPDCPTFYAQRPWGRGRLWQLVQRVHCVLRGHDWSLWYVEAVSDEFGRTSSPKADDDVSCFRGCARACGAVQMTTCMFAEVGWMNMNIGLQSAGNKGPKKTAQP